VVRRWGPARALVIVAESRVAVSTLRWRLQPWARPLGCITRVRLEAALAAPAPPGAAPERSSHTLAHGNGARVGSRSGGRGRAHLGDRGVGAHGPAPAAHARGAGARSQRAVRAASVALRGWSSRAGAEPGVGWQAVATGSDGPTRARPRGPGDAAASARSGHDPPPPPYWPCARW
jgi:hypothetical protein